MAIIPTDYPEVFAGMVKLIYEGCLLSKGILLSSDMEFNKVLNTYGTKSMKGKNLQKPSQ